MQLETILSQLRVPGSPRLERMLRLSIVLVLITNIGYAISMVVIARPASGYLTLWDGWLFHIATTLPMIPVGIRSFVERSARLPWSLVSVGIGLNTLGNLLFTYHDQNLKVVPFPGWPDAFFALSYLAFAIALVQITQRRNGDASKSVRLDGLIIGLSAGAIAVALGFGAILAQDGSSLSVLAGLTYPMVDLVFIVVVVAGLAPARFRPSWSSGLFMLAALAFAVSDIVFLNQLATDTYLPASAVDLGWLIGIAVFGLAPWATHQVTEHQPNHHSKANLSPGAASLPTLAATASLAVIAFALYSRVPRLAAWLAIAAVAVALLRVALTVRELRLANDAFRQARTDDLTSLTNRRGFAEELDRQLLTDARSLCVAVIDLNGFKEINDSLGHQAGDYLLQIVGQRFAEAVPFGGLVARLGGDEFGVILSGHSIKQSSAFAFIQTALERPIILDGIPVRVDASTGIAQFPAHGTTRLELLRAADVAMYDAKKNQLGTSWYEAEFDPHNRDGLALIEEMRTAIEQRSFEMHYQPTIDVRTKNVVGMEALIRWNHPTRGRLAPDAFIPIAERVGLIPGITRAVLDISIGYLASMTDTAGELRLSVNISAKDLVDDGLASFVRSVLHSHEVAPYLLTLEITETALSSDAVRAERTLVSLRELGVRISIDDFGVGYSSMSQLLKLPIDELKIDRSFLASLDTDNRAEAILSATVELGRTLGLSIVAEGVETLEAFEKVAERGIDIAQGYFFSKPLPGPEFERFVVQSRAQNIHVH